MLCATPVFQSESSDWYRYQSMAVPLGPVSSGISCSKEERVRIIRSLNVLLARWNDAYDSVATGPWYSVICDQYREIGNLRSSHARSKVRRGLRRNRVCLLESISEHRTALFNVYHAAWQRYGNAIQSERLSESSFNRQIDVECEFPDVFQYVGAYQGDELVAYSRNRLFGDHCVYYDTIKLAPVGLRDYSTYALIHWMNQHYLQERGFQFAHDGFRSLLHDSDFQQLLVDQLGFRRAYQNLFLHYRSDVGLLVRLAYPFRRWLGRADGRIAALLKMEEIHRACAMLRGTRT